MSSDTCDLAIRAGQSFSKPFCQGIAVLLTLPIVPHKPTCETVQENQV